ncbi:hypothetical protein bas09_0065 [Changchunvirus paulsarasin]|uniref:Uncharacterized protein n=2 Tax=Changchunvirus TaxID=2842593 RepID=A0AAE7VYV5_9CAUD|nr:putative apolipoprotein N-acyltransferase [Escherichia phage vB_EcoS_W011D]QCW18528.1 putative apolipoprotein N-acyltransferase [Escherichia phage vB_EcoS_W011D]QXV83710.1 hypothetical protein bas09_0065 [Escherichia phage PaulSarasin]
MNHADIRKVAEQIVEILGEHRPNSKCWDLIIKDVHHLQQPRVRLVSGDLNIEYIVGSPALETAMNALMREGEKFTVEPVEGKK